MITLIQRVSRASVGIDGEIRAKIGKGLLVFIGYSDRDTEEGIGKLFQKIMNLRVFGDENGKMNLSLMDIEGELLLVSQFTLYASTKKGNRPSFIGAGEPEHSKRLYEASIEYLKGHLGVRLQHGEFGADMKVELLNDGPVTIHIDTEQWK